MLYINRQLPACQDDDLCFVTEWHDNGDKICGIGPSQRDPYATVRLDLDIEPGLFVLSNDVESLTAIAALMSYPKVTRYPHIRYASNNFTITDVMLRPEVATPGILCKIHTNTIKESLMLHSSLKRENDVKYKCAAVSNYWNASRQVMFELICKRLHSTSENYEIPKTTLRWFDRNLTPKALAAPKIPLITFDIETVSDDPYRVPTGDAVHDNLFTVSVHHVDLKRIYTLAYVPIDGKTNAQLRKDLMTTDTYAPDAYDSQTNIIEVFNTEFGLLERTLHLLSWPVPRTHKSKYKICRPFHYLFGYNSLNYDMKYLLTRAAFFGFKNECASRFVYHNGFCLGLEQMHIDLFCIARMRYKLSRYTLNNLSLEILNDQKVDVNSVAIRFTFAHIRKTQRLWPKDDRYMAREQMPALYDILHYNNRDTMLVSELIEKTNAIQYLYDYGHNSRIPMSTINTNFNKIFYRLLSQCEVVALESRKFLTTFKSSRQTLILPLAENFDQLLPGVIENDYVLRPVDYVTVDRDNSTHLSSNKGRYPGGVNFCLGEIDAPNVHEYDYRIAYPLLMERLNISDETLSVMQANDLSFMFPYICFREQYRVFDYVVHSADDSKTATRVLLHNYIYNGNYCGGEFPFTLPELQKRGESPVIVIWCCPTIYTGVLSSIVRAFNRKREQAKLHWNSLAMTVETLKSTQQYYQNKMIEKMYEQEQLQQTQQQTPTTESTNPAIDDNAFDDDDGFICSDHEDDFKKAESEDDGFIYSDHEDAPSTVPPPPPSTNTICADSDIDDDDFNFIGSEDEEEPTIKPVVGSIAVTSQPTAAIPSGVAAAAAAAPPPTVKNYNFGDCPWVKETDNGKIQLSMPTQVDGYTLAQLIDIYQETITLLMIEHDAMKNLYQTLKPIVSSIYGAIGLAKAEMAAAITCIIRTTLLKEAHLAVTEYNRKVYYCDTDSMHVSPGPNLSAALNSRFPYTEIEMKEKGRSLYVATKVYYKWDENGRIKYGSNTHGPPAWRDMIEFFERSTHLTYKHEILQAFIDFFTQVYDNVIDRCVETDSLDMFKYLTHTVAVTSRKATQDLKNYLLKNYHSLAGAYKQEIYFLQCPTEPLQLVYRPSIEICSRDNETFSYKTQSIRDMCMLRLQHINLIKFFLPAFCTVYNLIHFHIKRNNQPFNVFLNDERVRLIMQRGYREAYTLKFEKYNADYREKVKKTNESSNT